VFINGLQVGYLGYQESHDFRRRMEELGCAAYAGECEARIRGGFKLEDGNRANFAVNLDLDPKTLASVNSTTGLPGQSSLGTIETAKMSDTPATTTLIIVLWMVAVVICAVIYLASQ